MSREEVIVEEFSPEQAGERVGWVAYREKEGSSSDLVVLDAAVATIGQEGAVVSHLDYGDGRKMYHRNSMRGFMAATALSVTIPRSSGQVTDLSQFYFRSSGQGYYGGRLEASDVFTSSISEHIDNVKWSNGDDLAADIKRVLKDRGVAQAYPTVYLGLNNFILHPQLGPKDNKESVRPVADPEMIEATSAEAAEAALIDSNLKLAGGVDSMMLTRLTVFSEVPPEEIPDSFVQSRRSVAQLEADILDSANRMLFKWGAFLPVGFRPNGRTWPYMDPTISDEQRAFGHELEALKTQNVKPAERELRYEIKELDKRIEHAGHGLAALLRLKDAEARAS